MPEAASKERARRYRDTYLEEARALHALLTDGAPPAGYHIRRGLALRHAETKKPIVSSYTSEWRPARERAEDGSESDRPFNPFVLQQHLLGKYDVAWQSPSWTSLIVFDIDRPELSYAPGEPVDPARELDADQARDAVLAELWDAFGFDKEKQPVILRTPGGGYHVYLPLSRSDSAEERTWPAAWAREHIEHHLNQHGIELRPGRLELFPSGIRLRAPCGAKMALLRPTRPDFSDDLGLKLEHARVCLRKDPRTGEKKDALVRQVGPMVRAFLDAIEAARRPLEAWTERQQPAWDATWGPWGARGEEPSAPEKSSTRSSRDTALSQHKEEVPGVVGRQPLPSSVSPGPISFPSSGGPLLYGAAFRERVRTLTEEGLSERGERHDAALKLTWHWGKARGLDRQTTLARVREWLTSFEHVSATRARSAYAFVRDTMREVAHYFDRHVAPAGGCTRARGADLALRPLPKSDRAAILPEVEPDARQAAETVLRYLRGEADRAGRVPHPVNLSGKILAALCGERRIRVVDADGSVRRRRAYVVAIEELTRLGVLALHTNYSTGRHGRLHTCWYRFGSGSLPAREAGGAAVVATRTVEEGTLHVIADGGGAIRCRLDVRGSRLDVSKPERRTPTAPVSSPPARRGGAAPWWVRMYGRRAFTPAEFFEGEERKVIPGPFRHQWRDEGTAVMGRSSLVVGGDPPKDPGSGGPSTPPPSGSGPPLLSFSSPSSANSSPRGPASAPLRSEEDGPPSPAPSPPHWGDGEGPVSGDRPQPDGGREPSETNDQRPTTKNGGAPRRQKPPLDQNAGSECDREPRIERDGARGERVQESGHRSQSDCTDTPSETNDQRPTTNDADRDRFASFARLFVDGEADDEELQSAIRLSWLAWEKRRKR